MKNHLIERHEIPSINNLTLNADEFDAVSYYRDSEGGYNFIVMKLEEAQHDYEVSDLGTKFIMVFVEKGENVVQEAILGDPLHILKNFVKAKCEGMIIKKCSKGKELLDRILRAAEIKKMARTLEAMIKSKQASLV